MTPDQAQTMMNIAAIINMTPEQLDRLDKVHLLGLLDSLVGACRTPDGQPRKPDRRALARARAALPEWCMNTQKEHADDQR